MRHWIGMVLAVVMAGVLFFLGAWGYRRLLRFPVLGDRLSQLPGGGGSLIPDHSQLVALAAIAATGLLAGIFVAAPRISPLAAGLPGLLLLGWTGLYLLSVHRAVGLIPLRSGSSGAGFEAMLFNGILGAAGTAMVIPMFVPSRWRAHRISYDEAAGDDEFPTIMGGAGRRPPAADLPAPFHEPLDTVVPRPRSGHVRPDVP